MGNIQWKKREEIKNRNRNKRFNKHHSSNNIDKTRLGLILNDNNMSVEQRVEKYKFSFPQIIDDEGWGKYD